MANSLVFNFAAQSMRVVMVAGEPWFIAADVCKALDVAEVHRALARLDDDEKGRHSMTTPGGQQELSIVNESGLYSLILTSRKPEAKKFKKWVTGEVLPSIRKTGQYAMPNVSINPSSNIRKPYDGVEHISAHHYHLIQDHVRRIEDHFHHSGGANHAAYAALRQLFGIHRIMDLPDNQFEDACHLLRQLERIAFKFRCVVMKNETTFFRRAFRGRPFVDNELDLVLLGELRELVTQRDTALQQLV